MSSSHLDDTQANDHTPARSPALPQGPTYNEIPPTEFFRTLKVVPITSEESLVHRQNAQAPKNTTNQKVGRRSAGKLMHLMKMPMDIFLEIASHLHPSDLLNVSRSSKWFRSILFAKRNRGVWDDAFRRIVDLPACPDDMSGPLYAALLFERTCLACGSGRSTWVDYATRTRFCSKCGQANTKHITEAFTEFKGRRETLAMQLSTCNIMRCAEHGRSRIEPMERTGKELYYLPELLVVLAYLRTVPDDVLDTLDVDERLACVRRRQIHAVEVQTWEDEVCKRQAEEEKLIRKNREESILAKLSELGYEVDDFPTTRKWQQLVDQPKELTDRIWNNLLPKLETLIMEKKQSLIHEAFMKRKDKRRNKIALYYAAFLIHQCTEEERTLMPNIHTATRLPVLDALAGKDGAHGRVSRIDFYDAHDDIRAQAERYKDEYKHALAELFLLDIGPQPRPRVSETGSLILVPDGLRDLSPDELFTNPKALFSCEMPDCEELDPLPYPDIHQHWHETHPNEPWQRRRSGKAWGRPYGREWLRAYVDPMHTFNAQYILCAVGLSQDTAQDELMALIRSGRLYCTCEDPAMPPPTELTWGKLLNHVGRHQSWHERRERFKIDSKDLRTPGYAEAHHLLYLNDHLIDETHCPVKLLPDDADTSAGEYRFLADSVSRATVKAKLAKKPTDRTYEVSCRLCRALTRASYKDWDVALRLQESVDGIVWHFRTKHGKENVQDKDIVFRPIFG